MTKTAARVPTREAYELFHEASVAFSRMEANGIRVDVPYLDRAIQETEQKIQDISRRMRDDKVYRLLRRRFGDKTNTGSRDQLGSVLYDDLGHPCASLTAKGKRQTTEASLISIDEDYVRDFLHVEKLKKTVNTTLKGIRREVVGEYLHPMYSLASGGKEDDDEKGGARSYRSSCSNPNFQNLPVRDPEMGPLVRKAFIPRDGGQFGERDYSVLEVRVAYCYHKDPNMRAYLLDPSKDMHRDSACEIFLLQPGQVSKQTRYIAKNMMVFPQFYGSYYIQCAPHLWEAIDRHKLRLVQPGDDPKKATGISLKDHLKRHGIRKLGACDPKEKPLPNTLEALVYESQTAMWDVRWPVYRDWKERWWNRYQELGWFRMKTGFVVDGVYSRNDVINYPVQGSGFHCTALSVVLIQKELKRLKMKSKVVGQIHDSIVGDCPAKETKAFMELSREVMEERVPKKWPWIIIPLATEGEVAPVNGNWHEKVVVKDA